MGFRRIAWPFGRAVRKSEDGSTPGTKAHWSMKSSRGSAFREKLEHARPSLPLSSRRGYSLSVLCCLFFAIYRIVEASSRDSRLFARDLRDKCLPENCPVLLLYP